MATQLATATPSLWTAAHEVDARRPRSLQTQLGASDTVCEARAAHIIAGTAPTDTSDKRAAILGTAAHEVLLGAARTEYGWLVERKVGDDMIRGSIDAVQLDEETAARLPKRHRPLVPAEHGVTVEDVKSKSTYKWDSVLRYGATKAELRQVYLYADLLRSVGFRDRIGQRYLARLGPVDVKFIRFRFVNRDNGAEHVQEFPYDPVEATAARWWVRQVLELKSPQEARRDFDGPGLDAICDFCPFRSACWPAAKVPGAAVQTVLIHDDVDRAQALASYVRGHEMETEGQRMKKKARKMLDASPPGVYGANELKWTGGSAKKADDVQQMVDLHELAGIPVPMVPDVSKMTRNLTKAGIAVPRRETDAKTAKTIHVIPARTP